MRSGGSWSGKVKRSAKPSCQASQAARVTTASAGGDPGGARRQRHQDHRQPVLEPTMQDRVGAAADRLEVDLSGRGMEQGQDLARATPDILVRPDCRVTLRPPTAARLRYSLERTSLVLAPDR